LLLIELRGGGVKARRPRASAVEAKRRAFYAEEHSGSIELVMANGRADRFVASIESFARATSPLDATRLWRLRHAPRVRPGISLPTDGSEEVRHEDLAERCRGGGIRRRESGHDLHRLQKAGDPPRTRRRPPLDSLETGMD
jgi:hypothetical protein